MLVVLWQWGLQRQNQGAQELLVDLIIGTISKGVLLVGSSAGETTVDQRNDNAMQIMIFVNS